MASAGGLEFRLLGPVEVESAGQRIEIGHARQRAVLAVLLLDLGRVVPMDLLIDRIWGDDPPATVRNVIYGYVARLKAALADAAEPGAELRRQAGGYLLEARPDQCDLHRFRGLVKQTAVAGSDEQAMMLLRGALGLWNGAALSGLSGSWLEGMRDSLELERYTARLDLNDIVLRQGQHGSLISELSEAAPAHPADERLIGQLMLALYRSGRQADALRWFEQTRHRLADDFGADPSPELQALHQQILRLDPVLAVPAPVVPLRGAHDRADQATATVVPRELPPDVGAFTGRAAELAGLDRLLALPAPADVADGPDQAEAVVISAVSGTAGVGKTALAVRWAHRAAGHFPDGQLYVNLRGYDPGEPMPAADALAGFLRSLGLTGPDIPADTDERAARYRTLMAGRRMLVLLDNASGAEQVRPLLPGAAGCRVLITSRDTLTGLVARDGARRLDLDLLPADDAITLLRTLIGARVDTEPDAAAMLATRCARLPLALRVAAELAAARPASPLAELADELADQQERLALLDADEDPRATVRAVFSWSYRNLDAPAAAAFRLLGTDPGPDLDSYAAAALTGTGLQQAHRVLRKLTRAHLIQPTAPDRYGLHDLLRAYARDLATAHDSEDQQRAALTRLFDYYLHTAATAAGTLFPAEQIARPAVSPATDIPALPGPGAARTWLDTQLASLASVSAYAADHGWHGHATSLAVLLRSYLGTGGHYTRAVAIHTSARTAANAAGDRAAEAGALIDLAATSMRNSHWERSAELLSQALPLCQEAGDLLGQARALGNLGLIACFQGRLGQSSAHLEQALALFRQTRSRKSETLTLAAIGNNHKFQGRYKEAAHCYQEALALAREDRNRATEAEILDHLGYLELRLGHPIRAREFFHRTLAYYRETGDRTGEIYPVAGLGRAAFQQDRFAEARDFAERALVISRDVGDRHGEAQALNDLGETVLATRRPEHARTAHDAALRLAEQTGDRHERARALSGLGCCYHALADPARSREHWQQALAVYSDLGSPEANQIQARLSVSADQDYCPA
jgi:DNA-binding SARP family transcriptional activator/tetratricopeptide (TPR) repeat protein